MACNPGPTRRVSVRTAATGNDASTRPVASKDGRYVAFESFSSVLVPGDTNNAKDIFVRDLVKGTIERVSVASDGTQSNADSDMPSISLDGRFVTWATDASNLVPGDTNAKRDVFLHDRLLKTTERISVSDSNAQGDQDSIPSRAAISDNGVYVTFSSSATNLVAGDTNGQADVFVRNRSTGKTIRVSLSGANNEGNGSSYSSGISGNGRFVAFESRASNLVAGDTNNADDVFVRDTMLNTIKRISVSSSGAQGIKAADSFNTFWMPSLSTDGRYIAFFSSLNGLVSNDANQKGDVFLHDRVTGTTTRVSLDANGAEFAAHSVVTGPISANGRYIAFMTYDFTAGNISFRAFVRDRTLNTSTRVDVSSSGIPATAYVQHVSLSADGSVAVFDSGSPNLTPDDGNEDIDVFARTLTACKQRPLYLHAFDNSVNGSSLYTFDAKTRAATLVGPITGSAAMYDIALAPNGTLYGSGSDNMLYTINPATAVTTLIGKSIAKPGLGFLPDGRMVAGYSHDLGFVDPSTGTWLGVLVNNPTYSTYGDVAADPQGMLYWATYSQTGVGTTLVRVDPVTLQQTPLFDNPATQVLGLAYIWGDLWGFTYDGQAVVFNQTTGRVFARFPLPGRWGGAASSPF